ncbi:MAG TPA: signal peptidase II [Acidimicrobiales bacterium]|nr:signal peptidase II [Acidimicrobiales bacterium]
MTAPPVVGSRSRRIGLLAGVSAFVIAADQITKSLAVSHLADHRDHLFGPFYLALSYNSGVAFSLGTGLTLPIIIIVVCLVGSVAWFARGVVTTSGAVGFGMILGGAIGNLADRLFRGHHGAVVDFLYSGFWPTFNVGDACIVIGSAVVAINYWRSGHHVARPAEPSDA